MTTLFLYHDIKQLKRDEHQHLKFNRLDNQKFAAKTNLLPVAGVEFMQAVRSYPIIFIGEPKKATPAVLLSLTREHNDYLDADGKWTAGHYIPAFVRRYPFVLSKEDENFAVCFDTAYEGFNDKEGEALFDENGQNTPFLEDTIKFLNGFTSEMVRTEQFVAKLNELDLLEPQTMTLTHPTGERFVLSDYCAVDEKKFAALSDEQILNLHKSGFLPWIYAHRMSMGNAGHLFDHYLDRKKLEPKTEAH